MYRDISYITLLIHVYSGDIVFNGQSASALAQSDYERLVFIQKRDQAREAKWYDMLETNLTAYAKVFPSKVRSVVCLCTINILLYIFTDHITCFLIRSFVVESGEVFPRHSEGSYG